MKPSHPNSRKSWLIFLSCLLAGGLGMPTQISAQIVPDSTLPVNSIITPNGNTLVIEGGTPAGGNLFHSFQEFSVPTGSEAYFNNSLTIKNILTRVTGGSISNIDGILRANGGANLFLLNPNGIVFGPNAALNIGGSFFASTADSLRLTDGSDFSATNPEAPPLLTINVPLGLQLGASPGQIINQSRAIDLNGNNGSNANNGNNIAGLSVRAGETIGLVGGNISIEGGSLRSPNGKIKLISLTNLFWELGQGQEQNQSQSQSQLTGAIANNQLGVVELTGQSNVSTSGVGGGSIDVLARQLSVRDGSQLTAITEGNEAGGGLRINTTESVEAIGISVNSLVPTRISSGSIGAGNAGNLRIETGNLIVRDGAEISTASQGNGNSGNLSVIASELVEVSGTSEDGQWASHLTGDITGAGAGGDLTIETGRLLLAGEGFVSASTFGAGTGGNISVRASESVKLMGTGFEQFELDFIAGFVGQSLTPASRTTGLFAINAGSGVSGNITIATPEFALQDGSIASAVRFGSGTGGRIAIGAERVELRGSILTASTVSDGAGGNIEIDTSELILADGGLIGNASLGSGNSGNILLRASEKVEMGSSPAGAVVGTGISADTFLGTGAGGNIKIETRRLIVRDGARISANSGLFTGDAIFPAGGAAANIEAIATEEVEISGMSPDGRVRSGLTSTTFSPADAGEVKISTGRLIVRDGAEISTSAFGGGAGGDITVTATEEVRLRGNGFRDFEDNIVANFVSGELTLSDRVTGMFAGTQGEGASGDISIQTPQLTVDEGAMIFTPTFGPGAGGTISINADRVEAIASGVGASTSGAGSAGTIEIDTAELIVRDGAIVATSTSAAGNGGNIFVRASESVELSVTPASALVGSGIFSDSIGGTGAGGNIQIDTARLSIADGARLSTTTGFLSGDGIIIVGGLGGSMQVRASESVELSGATGDFRSQISAATFSSADAGEVRIFTGSLAVRNGAEISVATLGSGQGGTLTVEASERAIFTGRSRDGRFNSSLLAASGDPAFEVQPTGAAGGLSIAVGGELIVSDRARVAVNSLGTGDAGTLEAIAREIRLDNSTITASPNAARGGNIQLAGRHVEFRRGSAITTDAGVFDGGNITINADTIAALENSDVSANAQAGFGGRVIVNAQGIFGTEFRERQTPLSDITATSQLGPQFSGIVEINTPEVDPGAGLVKLPGTLVDITGLVARDPCKHQDKSEFIITGRGGLPPNPFDPLSNPVIAIEWATREDAASAGVSSSRNASSRNASSRNASSRNYSSRNYSSRNRSNSSFSRDEQSREPQIIVEATGWLVDRNGDIVLTANPHLVSPQPGETAPKPPGLTHPECRASN